MINGFKEVTMNMWTEMKDLRPDQRYEMAMQHFLHHRNHAYLQHRFPDAGVLATAKWGPWLTERIEKEGFYVAKIAASEDQLMNPIKQKDFLNRQLIIIRDDYGVPKYYEIKKGQKIDPQLFKQMSRHLLREVSKHTLNTGSKTNLS